MTRSVFKDATGGVYHPLLGIGEFGLRQELDQGRQRGAEETPASLVVGAPESGLASVANSVWERQPRACTPGSLSVRRQRRSHEPASSNRHVSRKRAKQGCSQKSAFLEGNSPKLRLEPSLLPRRNTLEQHALIEPDV